MKTVNSQRITVLDFSVTVDLFNNSVTVDLTGTTWKDEEDKDVTCKVVINDESETVLDPSGSVDIEVPYVGDGAEIKVVVTDNGVEYSDTKILEAVTVERNLPSRFVPDRVNKRVIAVTRNLPLVSDHTGTPGETSATIYNPLHEKTESDFMPVSLIYYPGRYELDGYVIGEYDFGDQIIYLVNYKICTVFNVQSVNYNLIFARLHQLLMEDSCNPKNLEEAFFKLSLVLVGSENNIDVSTLLTDLEELLDITGLCEYEEPESDGLPAADVLIDGCNVEYTSSGATIKYKINNYDYVLNFSGAQGAISKSVTTSGCKKTTVHTFDFAAITQVVVNSIKDNGSIVSIVNDAMQSIEPGCIATVASWKAMTFAEKWKAILTKVCSCITSAPGDLVFEMDCDGIGTDDEFTLGVESSGTLTVPLLYTSGEGEVVINVSGNGFSGEFLVPNLTENTDVEVPITYDGSGDAGGPVEIVVSANDQDCTIELELLEEEDCTAPLSPTVVYDAGEVTISFAPAVSEPDDYTVLRRLESDPDIGGSYSTVGTPTFNIGTSRYEIAETFGPSENNKLWVYKIQSNCESSTPYITIEYAKIMCPEATVDVTDDTAEVSWAPVGGDVDRYVYGIYDDTDTLVGSLTTVNAPFGVAIEDTFAGLANGTYTLKVQAQIASTVWTSGDCEFEFEISVGSFTFINNDEDSSITILQMNGSSFLDIVSGSLPIGGGSQVVGTIDEDFVAGLLGVEVVTSAIDSHISLVINGIFIQCIPLAGTDFYVFSAQNYSPGDVVVVTVDVGSCD